MELLYWKSYQKFMAQKNNNKKNKTKQKESKNNKKKPNKAHSFINTIWDLFVKDKSFVDALSYLTVCLF